MAVPNGINVENLETVKLCANDILKIAEEINTEIFAPMNRNKELLFDAWQSENSKNVSEVYEEMSKSFEKYYNYLKESFNWINEATSKVSSADKEIERNYIDTVDV